MIEETRKKIEYSKMSWLRKLIGSCQKRDMIRNEVIQVETETNGIKPIQKEKSRLVWTRVQDECQQATSKSTEQPHTRKAKQRKNSKKWIDNMKEEVRDLGLRQAMVATKD